MSTFHKNRGYRCAAAHAHLPETSRQKVTESTRAFIFEHLGELTMAEMAEALRISERTVSHVICKIRRETGDPRCGLRTYTVGREYSENTRHDFRANIAPEKAGEAA